MGVQDKIELSVSRDIGHELELTRRLTSFAAAATNAVSGALGKALRSASANMDETSQANMQSVVKQSSALTGNLSCGHVLALLQETDSRIHRALSRPGVTQKAHCVRHLSVCPKTKAIRKQQTVTLQQKLLLRFPARQRLTLVSSAEACCRQAFH